MGSHALPTVQHFDAAGGGPCFYLLMHERLRHAVEVLVDGDVIIDIDARLVVASERGIGKPPAKDERVGREPLPCTECG